MGKDVNVSSVIMFERFLCTMMTQIQLGLLVDDIKHSEYTEPYNDVITNQIIYVLCHARVCTCD